MTTVSPGADGLHPTILYHVVNTLGWPALHPLQEAAVGPVLQGDDALLLAPTAGGKTEAVAFPLLTRIAAENWSGLSVLYICPLRALLNNIEPRLRTYAEWVGRRVAVWHGDVGAGPRQRVLRDPVDILLTTPESLEGMLVSTRVAAREIFADLRVVVVDEVHSFASDDRGWHLLAVLERLTRIAGRPLQRIGLSATVGNPSDLLSWLQGTRGSGRVGTVLNRPATGDTADPELHFDYVGSVLNAAAVIAALHKGEKRLAFADSRRTVETLAVRLRELGVETFVSHSSLSRDERHRAERAFSEAQGCVIVSTSTLELGIDVGDLDRVIQVGAPRTASSFLQRLGRTGRRPGTIRNALLLTTDDDELLQGAGILRLMIEGYIEPAVGPPTPHHVVAQQLLALCLQEGQVGSATWADWLEGAWTGSAEERTAIMKWLIETAHVDTDQGMLFIGPTAEKQFGHKNFLELVSVFTADPQITLMHGQTEIGTVDPMVLTRRVEGPRVLALSGKSWLVTYIEWRRRRAFVEPTEIRGETRWSGWPQPLSYAVCDAMRRVVLDGALGDVRVSKRAETELRRVRTEYTPRVDSEATVVLDDTDGPLWWTWAGARANAVLAAGLGAVTPGVVEAAGRFNNRYIRLNPPSGPALLAASLRAVRQHFGSAFDTIQPVVTDEALRQLKFADLLPPAIARSTLGARGADAVAAAIIADKPVIAGLVPG